MGYDMYMVRTPEGEDEEVARIQEVYGEALKVRDAIPREERGTLATEHWMDIPSDASARYRIAQGEVLRLSHAMDKARRSYFRLNVWGMSNVRDAMLASGMCYEHGDNSPWPDYPEEIGHIVEALQSDDDSMAEYLARYYPEKGEPTEEQVSTARTYIARTQELLREHPEGGTTIPIHKLGSNDGWLVTPAECLEAVSAWYARSPLEREHILKRAGIEGPDWEGRWEDWLAFLRLAASHDGFKVY